nr:lysine 5,6-aminomutase subunit alpha [Bacillota bacterium]
MSKLNLDGRLIESARESAGRIAEDMQKFINFHTTVAVERTITRLLGVDGVNDVGTPLPNVIVENLKSSGGLGIGAAYFLVNAMLNTGMTTQEIAEKAAAGEIDLTKLPAKPIGEIKGKAYELASEMTGRIKSNRGKRDEYLKTIGEGRRPYIYVIVATGNIYEDVVQAQAAAKQGADIIAVIRTTGQSLLDYVPYGATTEGFGGTYATQENFRIMRKALDESSREAGRYIRLCNYCSGLCMPEIAAMGA